MKKLLIAVFALASIFAFNTYADDNSAASMDNRDISSITADANNNNSDTMADAGVDDNAGSGVDDSSSADNNGMGADAGADTSTVADAGNSVDDTTGSTGGAQD